MNPGNLESIESEINPTPTNSKGVKNENQKVRIRVRNQSDEGQLSGSGGLYN